MSDDTKGWVQENALRVIGGLLMLVLGWTLTTTLSKMESTLDALNTNVQSLMQDRENLRARLAAAEVAVQSNAARLRELEQQVWQNEKRR